MRISLGFLVLIILSCADDERRMSETLKDRNKKEAVFSEINSAWRFNTQPQNTVAKDLSITWEHWRILLNEMSQKPQSSINAFRKKASLLSKRVQDLNESIPPQFDKPEIRSRIAVLATKTNALDLYLHLDEIPAKKAIAQITDINSELASLQRQMNEIVRKARIPKEEGELDMIRMLDTARAIPAAKPMINEPR